MVDEIAMGQSFLPVFQLFPVRIIPPMLNFMFHSSTTSYQLSILNPLNAQLIPVCYLLALLGAHHILHVSRKRVKYHISPISLRVSNLLSSLSKCRRDVVRIPFLVFWKNPIQISRCRKIAPRLTCVPVCSPRSPTPAWRSAPGLTGVLLNCYLITLHSHMATQPDNLTLQWKLSLLQT